jgi:hypothetical protein
MVDIPRKPEPVMVNWTADMPRRLKARHAKALSAKEDVFTFDGHGSIRDMPAT